MKKYSILIVLLLSTAIHAFASVGVGAELGFTFSTSEKRGGNFCATVKHSAIPCVLAVGGGIYTEWFDVSMTVDWWLSNPHLQGPLRWYYGPGTSIRIAFNESKENQFRNLAVLPRFLAGTTMFLLDNVEMYLQTALELGVSIQTGEKPVTFPYFRLPVNAGIRFWF